jgi:hypothetical protein
MNDSETETFIQREVDEIEKLLQRSPKFSKTIEIDGISLSEAFKRPDLRSAFESFHDRLHWSEDQPDTGAEGIEEFLLCYAFAMAGNPILAMPTPRDAAKFIWAHTGRQFNADYRAAADNANRGRLFELLPPVFVASTIHGCRTLLENAAGIHRTIVAAFRRGAPSDAGDVQFEPNERRGRLLDLPSVMIPPEGLSFRLTRTRACAAHLWTGCRHIKKR